VASQSLARKAAIAIAIAIAIASAIAGAGLVGGCVGGTVPVPSAAPVRAEDYVPVPYTPRPPPVEIVPSRPATPKGLVWADGSWQWAGDRFHWEPGSWVAPPPGAKRARWVIVRRADDGQLFFAPSSWRDASGRPIDPPTPLARASTRPGGPAGAGEITAPGGGGVRTDLDE
jgi:hypothetical protein